MGEWLYYNFEAASFHRKKLCGRLYSTEIEFYSKNRLLNHPLEDDLGGNVRTPFIARWKASGQLPIRHI